MPEVQARINALLAAGMTTGAAKFIHDERGIQTFGKARALARLHADLRLSLHMGPSEHGHGVLRACQQRIRSVRFARYSAQELYASIRGATHLFVCRRTAKA
ncbi:hypothetical protein ACVWWO_003741 [Bradyrhizobium sp. F1.13.1]